MKPESWYFTFLKPYDILDEIGSHHRQVWCHMSTLVGQLNWLTNQHWLVDQSARHAWRWLLAILSRQKNTQRNIFEILSNQSEIRLYLTFSDWFRVDLIIFRKDFSVWRYMTAADGIIRTINCLFCVGFCDGYSLWKITDLIEGLILFYLSLTTFISWYKIYYIKIYHIWVSLRNQFLFMPSFWHMNVDRLEITVSKNKPNKHSSQRWQMRGCTQKNLFGILLIQTKFGL